MRDNVIEVMRQEHIYIKSPMHVQVTDSIQPLDFATRPQGRHS